jgi:hypothetical protein
MIAPQYFCINNVDENTFILLRDNYLEICSMVHAQTNIMHAWLLLVAKNR